MWFLCFKFHQNPSRRSASVTVFLVAAVSDLMRVHGKFGSCQFFVHRKLGHPFSSESGDSTSSVHTKLISPEKRGPGYPGRRGGAFR